MRLRVLSFQAVRRRLARFVGSLVDLEVRDSEAIGRPCGNQQTSFRSLHASFSDGPSTWKSFEVHARLNGGFYVRKLIHAALAMTLAIGGGAAIGAAQSTEGSYVVSLRRLTEQVYPGCALSKTG